MTQEFPTISFLEIIQTEGAISFGPPVVYEGVTIQFFVGRHSGTAQIITSDEFITKRVAANHLRQLGMEELIPLIFNGD